MLLAASLIVLGSPVAHAQDDTGNETFLTSTSTSTTTSALTTAGGVVTVVLVTPDKDANAHLKRYLEHNTSATRQALHTGFGPACDDLAQFFAVAPERRRAFARLLRAERASLLHHLDDEALSAEAVHAFVHTLYHAMLDHDTLAHDARRLTNHHG